MFILGVRVDNLSKSEVLEKIRQLLLSNETGKQLITTNPEFILTAQNDVDFQKIINNSWLSVADGYGIRLAAKYLDLYCRDARSRVSTVIKKIFIGMKIAYWGFLKKDEKLDIIKETITGTDLMGEICRIMDYGLGIKDKKIFLLGGYGDTPRLVAERLSSFVIPTEEDPPVGGDDEWRNPLNIDYCTFEENNIIEKINNFAPTILFVALNHPRAQKWIDKNLPQMPSVKLAMGVGGAFDYWSEKIKRAPARWQGSYEWLWRLWHQPKRLKRIWQASVVFPWKVFGSVIQ